MLGSRTLSAHRRVRRGTSLIEVLVAAVLLAVGVAGTLSALAAAARLRTAARAREVVAAEAQERIGWFMAHACALTIADSVHTSAASVGHEAGVELLAHRDSAAASLDLTVSFTVPLVRSALHVVTARPCP